MQSVQVAWTSINSYAFSIGYTNIPIFDLRGLYGYIHLTNKAPLHSIKVNAQRAEQFDCVFLLLYPNYS